jgi:hypothetical protein
VGRKDLLLGLRGRKSLLLMDVANGLVTNLLLIN